MKKTLLSIIAFLSLCFCTQAQNSVTLNIHHKLADIDFALNEGAQNNMEHDFNVSRLQYYMSGFSLIHDGGTETALENAFHVLVNASQTTEVDLGMHDITQLEAIRFHIGVHPDFNHLDPSSYSNGHPLAPSFPSMHWGWAAGYRFLAMEGKGGSSYSQLYQLHGLGDNNYFMTEVPVELTAENGELVISLDGDYTQALEDVSVNSGVIVHGEYGAAKKALENFRDYVFSPSGIASSIVDFSEVTDFSVFPNPSNGNASFFISATENLQYDVLVTDILGRQVQYLDDVQGNTPVGFSVHRPGMYLVSLVKGGERVMVRKMISE